jgi:glycosidase
MIAPDWVADAIFYQIFPDRFAKSKRRVGKDNNGRTIVPWDSVPTQKNFFGGDLNGIIDSLDYLVEMGFNALYLNPIFKAGTNHRYDTFDYFQIDPMLGDDSDFERFIEEAHRREMRIVLDGVFNHCGLGFVPFADVRKHDAASKYSNWFSVYDWPISTHPVPNYATCGGADYLPRLNTANPEVEAFIHEVALYWLERGIDGWRLDVAYEIAPEFWRRFRTVIKKQYPEAYLVAEEWRDAGPMLKGDTFDGTMHYELRNIAFDFILNNALTGEAFGRALETLMYRYPIESEYGMLTILGTHDTARLLTLCDEREELVSLLFAFLFSMPGAPMVYYGDEIGMSGGNDPDCRRSMQWSSEKWRKPIEKAVRGLIRLRAERISLRRGSTRVVWANDRAVAIQREARGETTLIILNNSHSRRNLHIPVLSASMQLLLSSSTTRWEYLDKGELVFHDTPPRSYYVFDVQSQTDMIAE